MRLFEAGTFHREGAEKICLREGSRVSGRGSLLELLRGAFGVESEEAGEDFLVRDEIENPCQLMS